MTKKGKKKIFQESSSRAKCNSQLSTLISRVFTLWSEKSAQYIQLLSNKIRALRSAKPTHCLAGTEFANAFLRLILTNGVLKSSAEVNEGRNSEVLLPQFHRLWRVFVSNQPFLYQKQKQTLPTASTIKFIVMLMKKKTQEFSNSSKNHFFDCEMGAMKTTLS